MEDICRQSDISNITTMEDNSSNLLECLSLYEKSIYIQKLYMRLISNLVIKDDIKWLCDKRIDENNIKGWES